MKYFPEFLLTCTLIGAYVYNKDIFILLLCVVTLSAISVLLKMIYDDFKKRGD
jgi:hypothetical protein